MPPHIKGGGLRQAFVFRTSRIFDSW